MQYNHTPENIDGSQKNFSIDSHAKFAVSFKYKTFLF